MIERCFQLTI
uniref:Uncharacterized protein n=1 Tax=Anguilla anguilla TaxID=7936 RepID=A0A0E9VXB3_ANGAN